VINTNTINVGSGTIIGFTATVGNIDIVNSNTVNSPSINTTNLNSTNISTTNLTATSIISSQVSSGSLIGNTSDIRYSTVHTLLKVMGQDIPWNENIDTPLEVYGNNLNGGLSIYCEHFIDMQGFIIHSSKKLKKNIKNYEGDIDNFKKINIVEFNFKDDIKNNRKFGVIAEEIEQIYPETTVVSNGKHLSVDYSMLWNRNIKITQQLIKRIEDLEKEMLLMKKKLNGGGNGTN
jgi:hypothetical protein